MWKTFYVVCFHSEGFSGLPKFGATSLGYERGLTMKIGAHPESWLYLIFKYYVYPVFASQKYFILGFLT